MHQTPEELEWLLEKRNVVGVGVRHASGDIVVYVGEKVPEDQLAAEDLVPQQVDGTPVSVVDVGLGEDAEGFPALGLDLFVESTDRVRPVKAGVSTGHQNVTAGTSGVLARLDGGEEVRLSNAHVYAPGDAQVGDPIYQPGPIDGGDEGDTVGELTAYVPIEDGVRVDVAARTTEGEDGTGVYAKPGIVYPTGLRRPDDGEAVWKQGRTTGYTEGTVDTASASVDVTYSDGTYRIRDCIVTGDMSDGGDSGSPVFTTRDEFVGLLFAGSDTATVICAAANIETDLGCTIYTEDFTRTMDFDTSQAVSFEEPTVSGEIVSAPQSVAPGEEFGVTVEVTASAANTVSGDIGVSVGGTTTSGVSVMWTPTRSSETDDVYTAAESVTLVAPETYSPDGFVITATGAMDV